MAHSEQLLRDKIRQSEVLPLQWDKNRAWQEIQANLHSVPDRRKLAVAACITLAFLGLSFNQQIDREATQRVVTTMKVTASEECETVAPVKETLYETKIVKKRPAAPQVAVAEVVTPVVSEKPLQLDHVVQENAMLMAVESEQTPASIHNNISTKKIKPLLGIIPTGNIEATTTSRSPKLVWMQAQNENKSKPEADKKLILARIK